MISLLALEYRKLRGYRPFWWLMGLHFGFLFLFLTSLTSLGENLSISGQGFSFSNQDFYGFPDTWQNLAFAAKWFAIFLAILVINSITNEYSYRTNRQNIIDGLSRSQFITSKLMLVFSLSAIGTLFLLLSGTLLGGIYAGFDNYLDGISFLGAYFISVTGLYTLALLYGILIRRAAPAILLLLGHVTLLQGLFAWKVPESIRPYLPLKALGGLVPESFRRYFPINTDDLMGEVITYIPPDKLLASIVWVAVFVGACYLIENRRDL